MDYSTEMNRIVQEAQREANIALEVKSYAEAKRVLAGAVRDLRDLKRSITDHERSVRESYQDARLSVRSSGQTVGLFVGSRMRGAMARGRALEGRKLASKQAEALRPFARLKADADRAIAAVNNAKAEVTNQAAEAKEREAKRASSFSSPPQLASALPPHPPAWRADPLGKHEHRYWDGSAWTEHVASQGVASIDPYAS